MGSLSAVTSPFAGSGARRINLKTDLAPLADLIELAFADTMDSSGRAAIREMRSLSRVGPGLNLFPGMNDLVLGLGVGYVWTENGRLVGNVSIYPARLPREAPRAWIIANVAVHPDYRGRGIARQLMNDSLASIRAEAGRAGGEVILQVETGNWKARELYDSLGFREEGAFIHWRRPPARAPSAPAQAPYITRRGWGDWQAEYALAQRARPPERGGIGWLRPLVPSLFRPSLRKQLNNFFAMRGEERLMVRSSDGRACEAALWIERAFGAGGVQLTLMADPLADGAAGQALLLSAIRRFGEDSALVIEHPLADEATTALLESQSFRRTRSLMHMRKEVTS